jgi:hypothetical protein
MEYSYDLWRDLSHKDTSHRRNEDETLKPPRTSNTEKLAARNKVKKWCSWVPMRARTTGVGAFGGVVAGGEQPLQNCGQGDSWKTNAWLLSQPQVSFWCLHLAKSSCGFESQRVRDPWCYSPWSLGSDQRTHLGKWRLLSTSTSLDPPSNKNDHIPPCLL